MTDYRLNPDWYRTKHNLASERLNWAINGEPAKREERLALARECMLELLNQIEETLGAGRRKERPDAELRDFIAGDVKPNAELRLAEIEVAEQETTAPETTVDVPATTVETVLKTAPNTSELNYSIEIGRASCRERV